MRTTAKTVLVNEPNEVEREGLAFVFRRAGYAVALAAHGQEALDYLRAHPAPGLILTAMLMPVLDSWGFLQELRRLPALEAVPVVVATISHAIGQEWADAHACVAVVHKPVETEKLLQVVRRHLGQ